MRIYDLDEISRGIHIRIDSMHMYTYVILIVALIAIENMHISTMASVYEQPVAHQITGLRIKSPGCASNQHTLKRTSTKQRNASLALEAKKQRRGDAVCIQSHHTLTQLHLHAIHTVQ